MASLLYKGFYLFYDNNDLISLSISNCDNDANAVSYRLAESCDYDGSGTEIDIVAEYNTARIQNAFGIYLETLGTDLTYQFQYSDNGSSWTDLIAAIAIDQTKKVHQETAFDFISEVMPTELHAWWRLRINNPSQVAVTIRQLAIGQGLFFERAMSVGQTVPGYDQSVKTVGQPKKTGMPIGRKYYNRRLTFSSSINLLTPNSDATRDFWENYNTKPLFLIWNMSTDYYRPILLYRDLKKKPEKYDSYVTNSMILTGRGFV